MCMCQMLSSIYELAMTAIVAMNIQEREYLTIIIEWKIVLEY